MRLVSEHVNVDGLIKGVTAPAAARESAIPDGLFIFELANNHMGDVEHGLRIIERLAKVASKYPFHFGLKLQYRNLDTFIHPDYQNRTDIKYIKRFSETRLTSEQNRSLVAAIREHGLIPICTPFDESSVDRVVEDGFAILKIGSCSLTDWPLIEKIGTVSLPIIASTAGASLDDIDSFVTFMQNREKDFVLMHCIAEYPTTAARLHLSQIDLLQDRYPGVRIGYSTHEDPSDLVPVTMAIAKGVTIFEKHVGLATENYPLNTYSAGPEQVDAWLAAAQNAYEIAGLGEGRIQPTESEKASLIALRRGVFAACDIEAGERVTDSAVFMAMPTQPGQITANDWSKYTLFHATAPIRKHEPLLTNNTRGEDVHEKVKTIVRKVNALLREASIAVPGKAELEISHHYGIQKVEQFGSTMITVVNRDYCKKLIVVLPGQSHPEQFHKMKEETFHILYGELTVSLDGVEQICRPGGVVTVERGMKHAFESGEGAIFEEISSTHHSNDSFYTDSSITQNANRKTFLRYWLT
jgi:sialic acid synthase SpsE/quercetin dioxygenase-like cupin family protein